ncbi:hypothetical protein ACJX0J_027286 [Zea mays]
MDGGYVSLLEEEGYAHSINICAIAFCFVYITFNPDILNAVKNVAATYPQILICGPRTQHPFPLLGASFTGSKQQEDNNLTEWNAKCPILNKVGDKGERRSFCWASQRIITVAAAVANLHEKSDRNIIDISKVGFRESPCLGDAIISGQNVVQETSNTEE